MLGFGYFKSEAPTDFIVKYVGGKEKKRGKGLSFLYGPKTTVVKIPTTEQTVPFSFMELSADNLDVVVQGSILINLLPDTLLGKHDFTFAPKNGDYNDPRVLDEIFASVRLLLQDRMRPLINAKTLKDSLTQVKDLEEGLLATVATEEPNPFAALGVTIARLYISDVRSGNPQLKGAFEAEEREKLLASADRAVADRRMDAAKNDRALKEYESATALKLEGDRTALIEVRSANLAKEADAEAEATKARLAPYQEVDPAMVFAMGFREMAQSGQVGELNLTPDLLTALRTLNPGNGNGNVRTSSPRS